MSSKENKVDVDLPVSVDEMQEQVKAGQLHKANNKGDSKDIVGLFFNEYKPKLYAMRKINVPKSEVYDELDKAEKYIKLFNSGDEFTQFILGVTLDKIPIPEEFKDLINPESVRFTPSDRRTKNLIKYSKVKEDGLSLIEWHCVIDNLRRYRKMTSSDNIVMLNSLRTPKSFNDVMERMVLNSKFKVKLDSNPYIPISLDSVSTGMFKDDYFNISVKEIIQQYVAKMN